MGKKYKAKGVRLNMALRCPDQYRATETNPLFRLIISAQVPRGARIDRVVSIRCRQNDKLCSYRGKEGDCPYKPLRLG